MIYRQILATHSVFTGGLNLLSESVKFEDEKKKIIACLHKNTAGEVIIFVN